MSQFSARLSFFIISAALILILLLPLRLDAQTTQDTAEQGFLRAKIQLLQLRIELLKARIALLLGNIPARAAAQVYQVQNCAQLNVSWEKVARANSYRLYRGGVLIYEGVERSFVDSDLGLGQKYRYVVYGLRKGAQGEPSEVKEITAPDICPPQTPNLSFNAGSCGGNISLSWIGRAGTVSYQLFRAKRQIYSGPMARFVDSGLRPNTVYEYRVRAGNRGGWSNFSAPAAFQSSGVCASPALEVSLVVPETEKEGMLLAQMRRSPANNIRVRPDSANRAVMAFNVKARLSDITITRVDLFFDSQPWRFLDKVEIRFGGRTIAQKEISQEAFTRIGAEHIYQLRFDGLNAAVKKDKTAVFTVRVDVKEFPPGPLPHNITVFLENNSMRGIDKAGIFQLVPVSGGGKDGIFSRVFRIE